MSSVTTSTTKFKVVEFYRNNNRALTNRNPAALSNGHHSTLYDVLGFEIIGGYSADIPATIVNVAQDAPANIKVEDGDIIWEINGINTRHLTLSEVNKQLRSCGNRIYLKIKSGQLTTLNTGINASAIGNAGLIGTFQIEIDESIKRRIDEKLRECSSGDSDSDTEQPTYTPKGVDLPSAQRLAKRLYFLDGFKLNDVVRHLSKKNDFSQLVADEYLKLFNFESLTLDAALRKFLKQFQLTGDAQEKERVLMYFAKRYVDQNITAFNDVDSCHTLTCALMLLNTDLHDPKIQNKMTLNEFIENLKGLNNGANFPEVLLESLYSAIKNEPLECACIENDEFSSYEDRNHNGGHGNAAFSLRNNTNPFFQMPDPHTAKEYKSGWLLRKCCYDADGKKSAFLKRSWKIFYASLRDMVLYLHKDDKVFKNSTFDNITNAIRIHHALATVASDYKKKQFVFRLKTADWAEYLFQTSNSNELYDWISSINLVAAMFSAPPLPGAISSTKTFQRPLMPVAKTRYTLSEQCEYHRKHLKQLQGDLARLGIDTTISTVSATGASLGGISNGHPKDTFDKDKYNYYQFEIQRYTTYINILEEQIASEGPLNHPTNILPTTPPVMPQITVINTSSPNHESFMGGISRNGLVNGRGAHFNDSSPSKSMPSTPTHLISSSSLVSHHHRTNNPMGSPPLSFTKTNGELPVSLSPTTTITTSITTTPTTVNSKKFNSYLD